MKRSQFERYAFLFMRLSGVALLLLAVGHMFLQHIFRDVHNLTLMVVADAWRVHFIAFGEYSKDIEVFAHIDTTDWQEFLSISEEINLAVLGVLEANEARLAVPPR